MNKNNGFDDFFYASGDGIQLHARVYHGDAGGLPLVCLPGLTRNARDFHDLAIWLAHRPDHPRAVVAFDYRGRGQSDAHPDWKTYDVGTEAGDILAGLAALDISKADFLGTSRGGLIIHVLAVLRPEILNRIILNDIGPVLEPEGLALIKSYLGGPRRRISTFEEAAAIQKATHARAFPLLTDQDWLDVAHALYRDSDGEIILDFDPALLNGLAAFDLSKPIPSLWPQFEAMIDRPMMVIRGENSQLLSRETVAEMQRRHPGLVAVTADGQGHAPILHLGGLEAQIADFLDAA